MASTFQKLIPVRKSSFDLIRQLPPEILDRILFVYCDGKALSTLTVALSTALSDFYSNIAYNIIPTISKRLLMRIIVDIESNIVDGLNYADATRWIRLIAEDNNIDAPTKTLFGKEQCRINSKLEDGETSSELRCEIVESRRKVIRYCSENLALADFLRISMMESQRGKWEWPVWVGQISVSVIVDATVARSMTHIVILAPFDFPCHMPGSSLLYRHRTPTSLFRCEPMNMIPIPPWGRLLGLTATDKLALKRIALRLEEGGQSHVVVPTRNQEHDPLNIRILSKKDARLRILGAAPRFGSTLSELSTWLLHDDHVGRGDIDDNNNDVMNTLELVCCWENDTIDEIQPREYIEYIIILMKTRDRLIKEANIASNRCISHAETTSGSVYDR